MKFFKISVNILLVEFICLKVRKEICTSTPDLSNIYEYQNLFRFLVVVSESDLHMCFHYQRLDNVQLLE